MKSAGTVAGLIVALALAGCAVAPTAPGTTPPAWDAGPASSPWPDAHVNQISHDDPTLPIHIQWPVLKSADRLTEALAGWAKERETAFLAENKPAHDAPPELMGSWEAALEAGTLVGVRQKMYEFAGASGVNDSRTTYADVATGDVWTSADAVRPEARERAAAAILDVIVASGHQPFPETATDAKARASLLADLAFDRQGNLVVHVAEGLVTPFSDGDFTVTVPRATIDPLLSAVGTRLQMAYGEAAAPSTQPPSADSTTPAPPTTAPREPTQAPAQPKQPAQPPVQAPPAGSVDCEKVKCVALTFDDGPGPYTNKLLDHLEAAGAKATFFVLGSSVKVHPDIVRREVGAGMAVGNHTYTHKQLTKLSPAEQKAEMDRTDAALVAAGVPKSTIMRPPYGSHNAGTRSIGLPIILWDVDTLDWKNRNATATTAAVMKSVRPGSIVLFHDIQPSTVEAMPGILKQLKAKGYTLVTVPQLLPSAQGGQVYSRR